MKKIHLFHCAMLVSMVICLGGFAWTITGCNTTQQTVAYKTLSGLEIATTGAYDGYTALVIKGALPTNSLPQVSHAFNDFQAGMQVAVIAASNNTNALAPASLVTESAAVINLITTVTGTH